MRVLIADDEPLARRALAQLLGVHGDVEIVGECADGADVRDVLAQRDVDVLLLDVRMPELSGMDAARLVTGARPLVVFVTAHEEFGVPAFERGAVDYLLKPVTQARVDVALSRVRGRLAADADAARYRAMLSTPRYVDRLIARVGDRDVIIPTEVVELIAADDVYAAVHASGRRYLVRTPLDELERCLAPELFIRVHRSFIVPVGAVVAMRRVGGRVVLELRNGAAVPVSRRRRGELERLTTRDINSAAYDRGTAG
ncbi:MAG TPA: LytTR family DNA-binding domain-containing protein [Gemmatimonadaceae bacterium]|nr:LytTR family DNA-binding domain-containing protein [Gemmatimonadaceae bacterium]